MSDDKPLDFPMLLAASIHDIKNSLGMVLQSLEQVIDVSTLKDADDRKNYSILRGSASRINNDLIHLLGLYRLESNQLNINIQEVYVEDFLEEQLASQQLLFDAYEMNITINCDESLVAYFDENLVAGIINNILVNCAKYANQKILIEAYKVDDGINIDIIDDGKGYPNSIIENMKNNNRSIDFINGSTNLGLFFAKEIAQLHQCNGKKGHINLSNLDNKAGGKFTLYLP